MNCKQCDKMTEAKRLPPGWHRNPAGDPLCPACWHDRYILRAVTIPVASPIGLEWKDLRERLKVAFQDVTRLSNWAVSELMREDVKRTPDLKKLPKMPAHYLYPEARKFAPELPTSTTVSLLQSVERKYRARRFDVVWLGKQSLPNYRYPQPIPFHNATWKATLGDDGEALVSLRLGGERITLRLRGGHQFRRQLKSHRLLVDGLAVRGELALLEQRANAGDNRVGTAPATRLMCKMVGYFPREAKREREGVLIVITSEEAMLTACNAKNKRLWTIHADHVLRWAATHRRQLQAWSDDQKHELRRRKVPFAKRREDACRKYNRRMNTAADQIAAQLVNYADRYGFAELKWVEGQPKRTNEFRWVRLFDRIKQKCDAAGIVYSTLKAACGTPS